MIETKRLLIRPFQEEDAEIFFKLNQDKGFHLYSITSYLQTDLASTREWIKKHPFKYGVWEKETGDLIGMGGLTPWIWEEEELIDITYRFRESAWGKGYGSEVARALVDYGFNKLGLTQITATITPDNMGSKKIVEKLGMKFDKRILLLGVPTELYRLTLKTLK